MRKELFRATLATTLLTLACNLGVTAQSGVKPALNNEDSLGKGVPVNKMGYVETNPTPTIDLAVAGTIIAADTETAEVAASQTSTPSLTASPTETSTVDLNLAGTLIAGSQTSTVFPTPSVDPNKVYPGEFVFNSFKTSQDPNLNVLNYVVGEYPNISNLKGADSFLTSLANKFGPFSSDPNKEGGLEQQPEDILAYENNQSTGILEAAATTKVNTLIHYNTTTNLKTFGFRGERIDTAYLSAIAVDFANNPAEFVKANNEIMTIQDVKTNPKLENEVEKIEDSILAETQQIYIGTELNADNLIPDTAKRKRQYESCDVYRAVADNRVSQPQVLRNVTHTDNSEETFQQANSGDEILITGADDPKTNKSVVEGFIGRSYVGSEKGSNEVVPGQIESVVDEQELPCRKTLVSFPGPTGTIVFSVPTTLPPLTPVIPPTPTKVAPTTTFSPGQTPVATATKASTRVTPVATTPVHTIAPVATATPKFTVPATVPTSVLG